MDFDKYQKLAIKTDLDAEFLGEVMEKHSLNTVAFMNKVLGVVGEAGEFADKVKKIMRDKKGEFNDEDREAIVKELGDVLWYVAVVALYLGMPMSELAGKKNEKLQSRMKRNALQGSGDDR